MTVVRQDIARLITEEEGADPASPYFQDMVEEMDAILQRLELRFGGSLRITNDDT